MAEQPKPSITRGQAMAARPLAAKVVARKTTEGGGQRITILTEPSRFARLILRAPASIQRQFELDSIGVEVLDQCDGSRTVRQIIDRFIATHGVDDHEAERAVTTFLQMLIRKGLVTIAVMG